MKDREKDDVVKEDEEKKKREKKNRSERFCCCESSIQIRLARSAPAENGENSIISPAGRVNIIQL